MSRMASHWNDKKRLKNVEAFHQSSPHILKRDFTSVCVEEERKNPGHYPSKKENSGYFTSSSSYRRCCCGGPPLSLESFATIWLYFFFFFSKKFHSFVSSSIDIFCVSMGKHLVTKILKKRKTLAVAELPLCVTSTQEGGEKRWRRR